MDYSIVIPVYNSSGSLVELADRIRNVFLSNVEGSFEIIYVDDGSSNPETWQVLARLAEQNSYVKAIQLTRNFGKPGAVICGLHEATGKYIITMDDDLQHLPEDIPLLIEHREHDVVVAHFADKKHSGVKKVFSTINNWFETKLLGKPAHIKSTPFKLIRAEIVKAMLAIKTPYPYVAALIYYITKDAVAVNVHHGKRPYNKSDFTLRGMLSIFSNLMINNSAFLLKLVAFLGISMSILSGAVGAYFLYKKVFIGIPVSGWTSIVVILLAIGGILLFSVGIVGEYLIRIINGIEHKPPFVIRKKVGVEGPVDRMLL